MVRTLNTRPAGPGSVAALRLVETNRRLFDVPAPPPGALDHRIDALEAALAASRAEAADAQNRLNVFEASTSWRLTRPLRWAVDAMRMGRTRPVAPAAPPLPAAAPSALSYGDWIRTQEPGCLAELGRTGAGHQAIGRQRLGLVLLAPADGHGPAAESHDGCTILTVDQALPPAEIVAQALDQMDVDLMCFLDARDRLAPGALALVAAMLAQYPQTDLLFADEDWLDAEDARVRPFFKPGWDAELQRGRDLVGPFAFFRTRLVGQAVLPPSPAWRYDLANQVAAATWPDRIRHVPAVLCHRRTLPPGHAEAMRPALAAQLQREGVAARIVPLPGPAGYMRVVYELPRPTPLVSVIIATRDHPELLQACADGILGKTDYDRLQVLIVDNGSVDPDALALLDHLAADARVTVLRRPGPFNWSA